MSDSTKLLLAKSLQELMARRALSRITISDICELCDMNRKSFYYHFHDKYDLVNWIFRRDVTAALDANPRRDPLLVICSCLQDNSAFYRSVLHQQGSSPLALCMDALLRPLLTARMAPGAQEGDPAMPEICVHAVRSSIVHWVCSGFPQKAPDFIRSLYHAFAQLNRLP